MRRSVLALRLILAVGVVTSGIATPEVAADGPFVVSSNDSVVAEPSTGTRGIRLAAGPHIEPVGAALV